MNQAANKAHLQSLPMREIKRSLPMALLKAREAAMDQFRPLLRKNGFTEQQWRVIRVLAEVDQIEASELARRCVLLAPSLSRILQYLAQQKLIQRKLVASDQRRSTIALTVRGRRRFDAIAPASEGIYAEIERRLGQPELAELFRLLEQLQAALPSEAT